jgi:cytochrome P450
MNGDVVAGPATLDPSEPARFRDDCHGPVFAYLRREHPVYHCASGPHGPYWSVTRLDDIVAVESDHETYSSAGNVIISDVAPDFDAPAFATSDPPVHTQERRAVLPAVSTKRLAQLEAAISGRLNELLDGLPIGPAFDWAARVSAELTTQMAALLFDFPWEERGQLLRWCEAVVTSPEPGSALGGSPARAAALQAYRDRIDDMWRERARQGPGGDILSELARCPQTARLVDDPARMIGTVTLIAGANEAARGALSGAVVAFDRYPRQWALLRQAPGLTANAVSEIIRWQTPVLHMRRTATRDTELRGHTLHRGDRVVLWYCSANRDEAHFADGDTLDIERANARRHLAFGWGIHACLGRHAAELQLRLLLKAMRERYERVEVFAPPRRLLSNFAGGYESLMVRLHPRRQSSKNAITR